MATGGAAVTTRMGSVPTTDAYRAATTNAITKAASRLGIGLEVFKGHQKETPTRQRSRQGRLKRSKKPEKHPSLESLQSMAKVELEKLTFEDTDDVEPSLVQTLARKMDALGLKMQPVRLIHLLFGEGGFSQKRVMAACNMLSKLSANDITMLNSWNGSES